MQVMTKAQVRKLAKERFGLNANVVSVSSLDRHQRFGVMLTVPKGAVGSSALVCLGHGDSWEACWNHCLTGQNGIDWANEWKKTLEDYSRFKDDPQGYLKEKQDEIKKLNDITAL